MKAIAHRLSWVSLLSISLKLAFPLLVWLGLSTRMAGLLVTAAVLPFMFKIARECITGNYFEPLEEKYIRLREQEIICTMPIQSVEEFTGANRAHSRPLSSHTARGRLSASAPTATSSSARLLRMLRVLFRPTTPALIRAGRPPTDGASL